MRVSNISFGKTAILTCQVKNRETNQKASATLYQMDPHNMSDYREVRYSKTARCMCRDMEDDQSLYNPVREYYVLKDDKTGEVISCAETSHHYRRDEIYSPGLSTTVDELADNTKYVNSTEPMLAFVAQKAFDRYDKSVVIGTYVDDESPLKRARFSKTKNGDWVLPEKRFNDFVDTANKRSSIEYVG